MLVRRRPGEPEMQVIDRLSHLFRSNVMVRLWEKKDQGYTGWDDPDEDFDYVGRIKKAAEEGRWLDVAGLAMFRWNKGNGDGP